ncbi:MAG: hypothetical protein WBA45_05685 [Microthrixaceae bacterium]
MKIRDIPLRVSTGAYVLHAGMSKWNGGEDLAIGLHSGAKGPFPFLEGVPPKTFLKGLAAGEMATGAVLLSPFASSRLAGAALAGFSGSLLTMYMKTPAMREPGSIWPSQDGTAVSKDVWMFGIALSLLMSGRRHKPHTVKAHPVKAAAKSAAVTSAAIKSKVADHSD